MINEEKFSIDKKKFEAADQYLREIPRPDNFDEEVNDKMKQIFIETFKLLKNNPGWFDGDPNDSCIIMEKAGWVAEKAIQIDKKYRDIAFGRV